ncbi:MAG: sulfatase, partial [Acidobacteria bacterium]|nr:sulfatase [Acidobacteriota bacterium]
LTAAAQPRRKPNFIVVLVDDLGWRDWGCYGHTLHETPHIDRLAADSVRFTQAYAACCVCSPTRAALMTGKYPARLQLTDWIPGRRQWPASKLLFVEFRNELPLAEETLAEALKPAGYKSASIGKWHLGHDGHLPEHQGFDLNVAGDRRGSPPGYFGPFQMTNLTGGTKDDLLTDKLTEKAVAFMEANRNSPFLLYLPHYTVHTPIQAPAALVEKYKRKGAENPTYAAMMETLDNSIGSLRAAVERLGLDRDTVWMITSDNGGLRFEGKAPLPVTDNAPARAGKGHLYEGGIRVPLLIRWPGVTRSGALESTPVTTPDLNATVREIAGVPTAPALDGVSLAGLLKGRKLKDRAIYWHYPHYSNQGGTPSGAVREGDWKLIEFYEDERIEVYNLKTDPGETRNLAVAEKPRAAKLHAKLTAWRKSVNATMPKVNPAYDPAKAGQGLTGVEKPTTPI